MWAPQFQFQPNISVYSDFLEIRGLLASISSDYLVFTVISFIILNRIELSLNQRKTFTSVKAKFDLLETAQKVSYDNVVASHLSGSCFIIFETQRAAVRHIMVQSVYFLHFNQNIKIMTLLGSSGLGKPSYLKLFIS